MKKYTFAALLLVVIISLSACAAEKQPATAIPPEFTFSLTWGVFGLSSYDSVSGKLIKTTHATNLEDYITTFILNDDQKEIIRSELSKLDFSVYSTEYNPHKNIESSPSMTLILTVQYSGTKHTILCKDIAMSYKSDDKDGQMFLSVCESIVEILTETDEWQALPEYEFFYE